MLKSEAYVGMKIRFGRRNGEQTISEIIKINRKNFKVRQLEKRGVKKIRPVGTVWTVPPSMCTPVGEGSLREDVAKAARSIKSPEEQAVKDAEAGEKAMLAACSLKNPPTYIKSNRRYLDGHSLDRFGCEYDSQKSKLYASERFVKRGKQFKNLKQAQRFLNKVLGSAWFQRRFGKVSVRMEMTQGWTRSYCRRTQGLIRMLPEHLNERIILHELTHALTPKPHAGHGRLFCAIYLDLVRHYIGEGAYDQLLKGYRKNNVKYQPKRSVQR